MGNLWKLII